jgi:hypothetical protein
MAESFLGLAVFGRGGRFLAEIAQQTAHEETDAGSHHGAKGAEENGACGDAKEHGAEGHRAARRESGRFRNWEWKFIRFMAIRGENRVQHVNFRQDKAGDGEGFCEVAARHSGSIDVIFIMENRKISRICGTKAEIMLVLSVKQ